MKKTLLMLAMLATAPFAIAQTVPPDYPAQQDRSLEAQIESVRLNYEDVKAKAEQKLAQEKAAAQKAKAQEAARKAAAAKELAAQKRAAQLKAQARADQLEKRDDLSDVSIVLATCFHECHRIIKSGLYRLSHSFHLAFFLDLW